MTQPETRPTPAKPRKRRLRRFAIATAMLIAILVGVELFARYSLGLGDPPLMVADPQIEYIFKPSSTYHRFGNRIHYNAYSMRSDDFPPRKSDPNEIRILFIGDSVINGGSQADDATLVTTLLQQKLRSDLGKPVIVGNISAGSWGPPNELAYLKKFGLFDADILVIEESSHDYADVPTYSPVVGVNPDFPGAPPFSATTEAISRYLPRYLPWNKPARAHPSAPPVYPQKDIDWCVSSFIEMIDLARAAKASVLVMHHMEKTELTGTPMPGYQVFKTAAEKANVPFIDLGPVFAAAQKDGKLLYRDDIHPTPAGHKVMADTILPFIESELKKRP